MDKSALELVSEITEFNELHEFMQDADLDRALELMVKLSARIAEGEHIPPASAIRLVVELQNISAQMGVKGIYYQTLGKSKTGASDKKNIYKSVNDKLDKLVDAIKFMART